MTPLGTIGKTRDLSHSYAPGSSTTTVSFVMYGLVFEVIRFVRTDDCPCDNVEIYTRHESSWCSDFLKYVDRARPCRVGARALHLLAVAAAAAESSSDFEERAALLEVSTEKA